MIENPKCPHCGARQQRAAHEIVKSMNCEKCGKEFNPNAQEKQTISSSDVGQLDLNEMFGEKK